MSKRRTCLVTVNSLTALSKVRSPSSPNFISSIRNLSFSPERFELEPENEVQHPNRFNGNVSNPNSFVGFGEWPKNDVDRNLGVSSPSVGGFSGSNWSGNSQNFSVVEDHHKFRKNPESNLRESQGISNWYYGGNGNLQTFECSGQEGNVELGQRSLEHYNLQQRQVVSNGFHVGNGSGQNFHGSGFAQNSFQFSPTQENPIGNDAVDQPNSGGGRHQLNLIVPKSQPSINGGHDLLNLKDNQGLEELEYPKLEGNLAGSHWATLEALDDSCREGKLDKAVEILQSLEEQRVPIDLSRCWKLMEVCGEAAALEEARVIHDCVSRLLSPLDISVYNKILAMYSRCGAMDEAFAVFDRMPQRNLTSWDNMIVGLARNGQGESAIDMFTQFKLAGLQPDAQMFVGVFTACGVLNDINEGMLHFESMKKDYNIMPLMENYKSIVDMLGSCGYLVEALDFIEKMPMEPSVEIWETLMNLSRIHGHLELGDRCAELVRQIDPSHLDKESEAGLVPVKALELAKQKKLNQRHSETKSTTHHQYRAGDASHPDSDKHYALLRTLKVQMKDAGYIPETRFVLHDIDQESKEEAIHAHSERLATAQALLTSPARTPIRIIRNLRVCGDCHNFFKIISTILGREIIHRDAKRFHHVKDGVCSCRDYW